MLLAALGQSKGERGPEPGIAPRAVAHHQHSD